MRFSRREPLHRRLARAGGLDARPQPVDTRPWWGEVGIHGVSRPREWDAVVTAAAELDGVEARFVALPDGRLLVESGPSELRPLADAVEQALAPPYRAEAVSRGGDGWAVAARRIHLLALPGQAGDELDLTVGPDERHLVVDGESVIASVPALEALVAPHGHVHAHRLDGALWEVQATRL